MSKKYIKRAGTGLRNAHEHPTYVEMDTDEKLQFKNVIREVIDASPKDAWNIIQTSGMCSSMIEAYITRLVEKNRKYKARIETLSFTNADLQNRANNLESKYREQQWKNVDLTNMQTTFDTHISAEAHLREENLTLHTRIMELERIAAPATCLLGKIRVAEVNLQTANLKLDEATREVNRLHEANTTLVNKINVLDSDNKMLFNMLNPGIYASQEPNPTTYDGMYRQERTANHKLIVDLSSVNDTNNKLQNHIDRISTINCNLTEKLEKSRAEIDKYKTLYEESLSERKDLIAVNTGLSADNIYLIKCLEDNGIAVHKGQTPIINPGDTVVVKPRVLDPVSTAGEVKVSFFNYDEELTNGRDSKDSRS